jgi:hypothetical protein
MRTPNTIPGEKKGKHVLVVPAAAILVSGDEGGEETMAAAVDPLACFRGRRRFEIVERVEPSHADGVVVVIGSS